MNILIGLIILSISGGLSMYLDVNRNIDSPKLFWAIGALGGILSINLMILI